MRPRRLRLREGGGAIGSNLTGSIVEIRHRLRARDWVDRQFEFAAHGVKSPSLGPKSMAWPPVQTSLIHVVKTIVAESAPAAPIIRPRDGDFDTMSREFDPVHPIASA